MGKMIKLLRKQLGGNETYCTLQHWIDTSGPSRKWKKEVLEWVEKDGNRNVVVGCLGCPGALVCSYHDVCVLKYWQSEGGWIAWLVKKVKADLVAKCGAGLQVSIPLSCTIILGHVETMASGLLAVKKLKCSENFLQMFLGVKFRWSWWVDTCAAQKTPDNWEKLCEDTFLWIVYQAMVQGIIPEAMINGNQLGIWIVPLGNRTWAPHGAKQVETFGEEKKWQFTVMSGTMCLGDILPFQCIWKGSTNSHYQQQGYKQRQNRKEYSFHVEETHTGVI